MSNSKTFLPVNELDDDNPRQDEISRGEVSRQEGGNQEHRDGGNAEEEEEGDDVALQSLTTANTITTPHVISPIPLIVRRAIDSKTETESSSSQEFIESRTTNYSLGFSVGSSGRTVSSTHLLAMGHSPNSFSDPTLMCASRSDSDQPIGVKRCKSAPECTYRLGLIELSAASDGEINHRKRNKKVTRRDHRTKSPRVISTDVDDEFPSYYLDIYQQWSELGGLPSFTPRSGLRTEATASEFEGSPSPSSGSERNSRPRRRPLTYSYRQLAEDGIPVSPLDNNTRMDDIDLENISDDSGVHRVNRTLSEIEEDTGIPFDEWSWSDLSEEEATETTSSDSHICDNRKIRSEPGMNIKKKIEHIQQHSKQIQIRSLPDLGGFTTPNLSELEFAHMISRDEGDVGDVFSTSSEEDMSDTQAEIGSASSDNPTLPELDEEDDSDMSSWSDLSLIIEGIRVRREPDSYKPYLITQLSAKPRTKSAYIYKHPVSRQSRVSHRSVSDGQLPNKYSELHYNDCIGVETRSLDGITSLTETGQTFSIHDSTFLTEVQEPRGGRICTAGAGGGHDPHDSDSSDDDRKPSRRRRRRSPPSPLYPRKRSPKKIDDLEKAIKTGGLRRSRNRTNHNALAADKQSYNRKRADPPRVRHWTKPNKGRDTISLPSNLMVQGTSVAKGKPQGTFKNSLPILPAIASQRLSQQTDSVENRVAIEAVAAFQSCFPLERNTMMYKYLTDMAEYEEQQNHFLQVKLDEQVEDDISLRIKPSYGTVCVYNPLVGALHLRPTMSKRVPNMAQEEPPARPNTKQQTLLRCQRIETMLKINSENRIVKQPIYDAVREWTKGASRLTHQSRRVSDTKMIHKPLPKKIAKKLSTISKQSDSTSWSYPSGRPNTPCCYVAPVTSIQLAPITSNPLKNKLERKFNIREMITTDDREYRSKLSRLNLEARKSASYMFYSKHRLQRMGAGRTHKTSLSFDSPSYSFLS